MYKFAEDMAVMFAEFCDTKGLTADEIVLLSDEIVYRIDMAVEDAIQLRKEIGYA